MIAVLITLIFVLRKTHTFEFSQSRGNSTVKGATGILVVCGNSSKVIWFADKGITDVFSPISFEFKVWPWQTLTNVVLLADGGGGYQIVSLKVDEHDLGRTGVLMDWNPDVDKTVPKYDSLKHSYKRYPGDPDWNTECSKYRKRVRTGESPWGNPVDFAIPSVPIVCP